MLGRELFHVVEGVLVVGVGIIRHFGDRNPMSVRFGPRTLASV
jgi:hypothetical protein